VTPAAFVSLVQQNPVNRAILERLPALGLPDAWLVAGCLFQTVWNIRSGRPPEEGIKDYDVFYFDAADLSYEAEDRQIKRLDQAFADLAAPIELRNQARVHLWYGQRFGAGYPPLRSSRDGIDRFLVQCTCIAIASRSDGTLELYAPNGLADLAAGHLRANPLNLRGDRYSEKAASYRARWPWLTVEPIPA